MRLSSVSDECILSKQPPHCLGGKLQKAVLTSIHDTVKSDQDPGSGTENVKCFRAGRKLLGPVLLWVALVMKEV